VEAVKAKDKEAVRSLLEERVDVNSRQGDGATALMWAVHWNDMETTDLLIRAGANVNAANDNGVAPLRLACTNGNAAMVEKLLKAEANPNVSLSRTGETVLMTCARTGNVNAVKLLLARGADVNAKESWRGQTALMWAAAEKHAEVVRALIERGADVHASTKARTDLYDRTLGGFTPLLFAARVGDLESARILLAAGADVNEATPEAGNTLVVASASHHEELAVLLLEKGANPDGADEYGMTALHHAVQKGIANLSAVEYTPALMPPPNQPELVKALLAHGADPNARIKKDYRLSVAPYRHTSPVGIVGATPFFLAAAAGDANIMRVLVAGGADPLLEAGESMRPLMVAAGMTRLVDFLPGEEGSHLEAVKLALELGADINEATERGETALHAAASTGADTIVEFLVDQGAQVNAKDNLGRTPWSRAAGFYPSFGTASANTLVSIRPHPRTAELLLKLGATQMTEKDFPHPSTLRTSGYVTNTEREQERAKQANPSSVPAR
ncbi:MAG: ankyrin repeat domain-containing protein, partial [Terriglobia bacterium]